MPCDWYWLIGFWSADESPAPSPKFHDQVSGHSGDVVDMSVNWKSVFFFLPIVGSSQKSAVGGAQNGVGSGWVSG